MSWTPITWYGGVAVKFSSCEVCFAPHNLDRCNHAGNCFPWTAIFNQRKYEDFYHQGTDSDDLWKEDDDLHEEDYCYGINNNCECYGCLDVLEMYSNDEHYEEEDCIDQEMHFFDDNDNCIGINYGCECHGCLDALDMLPNEDYYEEEDCVVQVMHENCFEYFRMDEIEDDFCVGINYDCECTGCISVLEEDFYCDDNDLRGNDDYDLDDNSYWLCDEYDQCYQCERCCVSYYG